MQGGAGGDEGGEAGGDEGGEGGEGGEVGGGGGEGGEGGGGGGGGGEGGGVSTLGSGEAASERRCSFAWSVTSPACMWSATSATWIFDDDALCVRQVSYFSICT